MTPHRRGDLAGLSAIVVVGFAHDCEPVKDGENAAQTEREELENSHPGIAYVEPIDAEVAEHHGEYYRHRSVFSLGVILRHEHHLLLIRHAFLIAHQFRCTKLSHRNSPP